MKQTKLFHYSRNISINEYFYIPVAAGVVQNVMMVMNILRMLQRSDGSSM